MFQLPLDTQLHQYYYKWARYLVMVIILIGILVLLGWHFDLNFFKRPLPGMIAMNPATALLFICSGIAFFLLYNGNARARYIYPGYVLASGVVAIALIRLLDIIFGLNIPVDRLLYNARIREDAIYNISNHMAPNTATAFILAGCSLLTLHVQTTKGKIPVNFLALSLAMISLFSVLGYLYNIPPLYGVPSQVPMALHTAVCFFLFSLAILFVNPAKGIMKLVTGKLIGSITARLLIPFAFFVPIILGMLRIYGHWSGWYSTELGVALLVISIIIVFMVIIWYNAVLLNKRDMQRLQVEEKVKRFNEELEEQVKIKTGELVSIFDRITDGFIALDKKFCYTYVNKKIGELLHRDPASLIGKNVWEEFPRNDNSQTYNAFMQAMQEQRYIVNIDYYQPLDLWQENHIYPSPDGLSVFVKDITMRKKAEIELKNLEKKVFCQKIEEQKKISRAIIRAQEQEKNHIGKELHDNINQVLAGTKIYLSIAANKDSSIKELLKYPMQLIDDTVRELRALSHKQVTPILDINLEELVNNLLITLNDKDIRTVFSCAVSNKNLPDDLKLNIYRIIQVKVSNIIKHAVAQNVILSIVQKDEIIEINITDDGIGFNTANKRNGIGISNMINRIESYNGKLNMISSPGNGCKTNICIPLGNT